MEMKINTSTIIKDLNGGNVANGRKTVQGLPPVWYTVRDMLCELIQMEGLPVAPDEKLKLFGMGIKIANSEGELEITEAEKKLLLSIIKYHPSTLAVGRVTEELEK